MDLRVDKRQHPRAGINWPVVIVTREGSFEGVALNISSNGAFIHCKNPLKPNEVFKMMINAAPAGRALTVGAEVVWSTVYGPGHDTVPDGMGVKFVDISQADQDIISNLVLDYLKLVRKYESEEPDEISIIELAGTD